MTYFCECRGSVTLISFILLAALFVHANAFSDILFSNFHDIRRWTPGYTNYTAIKGGLGDVRGIGYASDENYLFYISLEDHERTVIKRLNINKNENESKVLFDTSPQYKLDGLAVDWVTKKLYYTDFEANRIEVCQYDGSYRRVLVSEGLDQPRGIAVLPQKGYMFVTDWGDYPKIERFHMDGSNRKVIVKDNIKLPYTIFVDQESMLVYWGDVSLNKIEYMTIDGKNRKILEIDKTHFFPPHYLIVHSENLFWSDGKNRIYSLKNNSVSTIYSIDDYLGKGTLHPYGLAFYSKQVQPKVPNTCSTNNGGCSHLCLLTPNGHKCACPTGILLHADGKNCNKGMEKFLIIARKVDMKLMSLDADKNVDLILPIKNIKHAVGIDFDVRDEKVYWADLNTQSINRAFLNGTGFEKVISYDIKAPDHVAIDWVARNLYWTDGELNRIEVSRLDGTSRKIIVSEDLHDPRGIAVDPADGKIYWSDWGNISKIESSDLDGENRVVIRDHDLKWPNGITLDYQARKLYWVDASYKVVDSYDLSKKQYQRIYSAATHPFGITVLGDYIYWTDWIRKVVQFKKSSKEAKVILNGMAVSDVMGIKAVDMNPTYGTNDCYYAKNNCSHLCFHKAFDGAVCACPTRMELANDGKTCNVPSGFLLYSVAEGIKKMSIDTYKGSHRLPLNNAQSASLLDTYYADSRIFWVHGQENAFTINRAFLNGSGYEAIIKSGPTDINGLTVDWMGKNIYWAHDKPARIEVARMDGSYRKVLVYNADMVSPCLLLVNPHINKIFWFHQGLQGNKGYSLWEANLDGTEQKHLLANVIPSTAAIDYKTNIIYWMNRPDKTGHYSIQGYNRETKKRLVIRNSLPYSRGLVIFKDKIIFAENDKSYNIQILSTDNGKNMTKLVRDLKWVVDITVFHGSTQTGSNICSTNNAGCQHLCFSRTPTTRVCSCATHFSLNKDGVTCNEPSQFMIFQDGTSLLRLLFDQTKPEASLPVTVKQPNAPMDFDDIKRYLYWLDRPGKTLIRSSQDGSHFKKYNLEMKEDGKLSSLLIEPYDFTLDAFSNSIFWTDIKQHKINFLQLDSLNNGTIFQQNDYYPKIIVVHSQIARLFWSSHLNEAHSSGSSSIISTSLAGTDVQVLKTFDRAIIKDIAIDYEENQIYWIDAEYGRIASMSTKGSSMRYHQEKRLTKPISLAIYGEYIYWSDEDTKFIYKASKNINISNDDYEFHGGIYSKLSNILVVNLTRSKVQHPCRQNNGGCTHICSYDSEIHLSPDHHEQKAKCACPLLQTLEVGTKCIQAPNCSKNADEFYCKADSRCISGKKKCDYAYDCSDGQDELECSYPRQPCVYADNMMNCGHIGCIQTKFKCDGIAQCPDGSDELHCDLCEDGKFHCDGNSCIDITNKCNGVTDCHDATDEKYCSITNNGTVIARIIPPSIAKTSSRMIPGLITGGVIFFLLVVFVFFVIIKIRNSKKNSASRHHDNVDEWSLAQIHQTESINSDDHAKSSVSTYISAISQNTEPSYYDRNNVTGASSSSALTDFSRLPLDPPPSPATERALSTITETNNPFDYVVNDCRYINEDISCSELGHDAPPPTLASTTLIDDVDLYCPLPQETNNPWQPNNLLSRKNRNSRKNRHNNSRNRREPSTSYRYNNVGMRYSDDQLAAIDRDALQKQWLFESQEENLESPFDANDSYYLDIQKQRLLFDPPPTPCTTYMSEDDDRPSSPGYSIIHGGVNSHYAPPPSPTSQL